VTSDAIALTRENVFPRLTGSGDLPVDEEGTVYQQPYTRQDLHRYLKGCPFPCASAIFTQIARSNGAPEDLLAELQAVPNRYYLSERELADELARAGTLTNA